MWGKLKARQKALYYLGFAGPAMLFFIMVVLVPLVYGVYLTFTDWNGISLDMNFIGLENYRQVFHDTVFWRSLGLTVLYSAVAVVTTNLVAFGLAYLLTVPGFRRQGWHSLLSSLSRHGSIQDT